MPYSWWGTACWTTNIESYILSSISGDGTNTWYEFSVLCNHLKTLEPWHRNRTLRRVDVWFKHSLEEPALKLNLNRWTGVKLVQGEGAKQECLDKWLWLLG